MRYLVTIIIVLVSGLLANAQTPECKSPIEYGNRNQVDPKDSTVRRIFGSVISEIGDPAKRIGPVPACLGLFTEKDHRLVASAVADEEGRFEFGSIPPGRFRLVVRDPLNLFCLANTPIEVVKWRRGKERSLVIHMRPAGIDSCSYGDFK